MFRFLTSVAGLLALILMGVVPTAFAGPNAVGATTFYVSPAGSDSNAGTLAAPFQTIMKAVRLATAGDTILVRSGTYYE